MFPRAVSVLSLSNTPQVQFAGRLNAAVRDVNYTCDVRGVCEGFPSQLRALARAKGDRLPR